MLWTVSQRRAEGYHFSLDVRGEYQHAPGRAAYPESVQEIFAQIDSTPLVAPEPVPATNVFRLINANFATSVANNEFSVGKADDYWGPTQAGSMALSNNAEPIYALRINRVVPLRIPLFSDVLGPVRYEGLFGSLKGHRYPNAPWIQAQKFSFKPTRNLEFGFSRVVIFAGKDHVPLTFGSFWHSFTSFSNVSLAEKESRNDPGFRSSSFDFTWRLPWMEKWLTLYSDSIVHDDVSPLAAPRRAAINPGLYLSHFPGLPHVDLRAEAVSTDPVASDQGGQFLYYEFEYPDGYTNKGNMLGSWMGREGKGGQAWLTDWLSPKEYLQLGYRNAKVSKNFVPGGTTQNDFNVKSSASPQTQPGAECLRPGRVLEGSCLVSRTTARLHWVDPAHVLSQTKLAITPEMKTPERDGLRSGVWFDAGLSAIYPVCLTALGDSPLAAGSWSG